MGEQDYGERHNLDSLIRQQRESEEIALRMFRFKTRRGIGVTYLLTTIMVLFTLLAAEVFYSVIATLLLVAVTPFVVIYGSGIFGFRGIGRMSYAFDLIAGKENPHRSLIPIEGTYVLLVTWPWLVYTVLVNLSLVRYAYVFPLIYIAEVILLPVVSYLRKGNVIIKARIEDFAFFLTLIICALLVNVQSIGLEAFVFSFPVWILAGMKSLYEAPKEVLYEFGPGE